MNQMVIPSAVQGEPGAVFDSAVDVLQADVAIVIGAASASAQPAAAWIANAAARGTRLIVCEPRRSGLARLAHCHLQFKPATGVAMLNAMLHVIVHENLVVQDFIDRRTVGYDELVRNVAGYSPERMAPVCGIDAGTLRYVARLYARSGASMILWGAPRHARGADYARCLIALALLTGQVGRPGTGLHPLRGRKTDAGHGRAAAGARFAPADFVPAEFVPADIVPAAGRPDADYPMLLLAGRQLAHWPTGGMALAHPLDLAGLGAAVGDMVALASRRGTVTLRARADDSVPRGAVLAPFRCYQAATGNAAPQPLAGMPEFAYCAVSMTAQAATPGMDSRLRGNDATRSAL